MFQYWNKGGILKPPFFPYLLKLFGVGKVLVVLLSAKDNTPLGTLLIIDFQVMFSFSSIKSWAKSPCIVSCATLLFQSSNVCSWLDCFMAFFALGISKRRDSLTLKVFWGVGIKTESFWIFWSRICWHITIVEDFEVQTLSLSNQE